MCETCGCGQSGFSVDIHHDDNHHHHHHHDNVHNHNHDTMEITRNVLEKNDAFAELNRKFFKNKNAFTLNLISSPGSGKTTLLEQTITLLNNKYPITVLEGDQETSEDANRIRNKGINAIQINTGKGCHLDAHMIGHVIEQIDIKNSSLVFIENVGNLVCPADFDLGEFCKIVILSVTEGEDKPIKYPNVFFGAKLLIINKTDLLPYVDFNLDKCKTYVKQINPDIKILELSAKNPDTLYPWINWIMDNKK